MKWNWQKESILNNYNENTPSRDIFNAVCYEFGLYFEHKGGKFTKSKKRISFEKNGIRLVIGFNSSRSNIGGNWIAVELGISFFYLDFIDPGKEYTGSIFGDMELFSRKLVGYPEGTVIIRKIVGTDIERIEEGREPEEHFGNVFNCYGLSETDFVRIASFLENNVLIWLDKINDENEVAKIIENAGAHAKWSMRNSRFRDFLKVQHPDLIEIYDEKVITPG